MKTRTKVIYVLSTLLLTLTLISAGCVAYASDTNWYWGSGVAFGVASSALDDLDARDAQITGSHVAYMGTYHESGVDGWTGPTGFYWADFRAPLHWTRDQYGHLTGESKTWTFYLWWNQSNPSPLLQLYLYNVQNAASDMKYTLTYVRAPLGTITGQGVCSVAAGTSIDLQEANGTRWDFPAYATADGRTGYEFQFTAALVAEPSSLFALGCPIFGLAGLAVRRRERSLKR